MRPQGSSISRPARGWQRGSTRIERHAAEHQEQGRVAVLKRGVLHRQDRAEGKKGEGASRFQEGRTKNSNTSPGRADPAAEHEEGTKTGFLSCVLPM